MEGKLTDGNKKGFFQNDRMLVCSMFAFYGICILGLIAATFWGLYRRSQVISANETATAVVVATEQAKVTATANAISTEQAQFDDIDHFQADLDRWFVGPINNEYWVGSVSVKDGVYIWDVDEVKKTFVWWGDFYRGEKSRDFDAYVDSKMIEGNQREVCSGLIFRKSPDGWDSGSYAFAVCNDSHFEVHYHGKDGWEDLSGWKYSDVIHPADWNRIGVSARGDRFTMTINNAVVFEFTDDRQELGGLAVFIEVKEENPAVIWFDNFGFQSR